MWGILAAALYVDIVFTSVAVGVFVFADDPNMLIAMGFWNAIAVFAIIPGVMIAEAVNRRAGH